MCLFRWTVYSRGEAIDWKSAEEEVEDALEEVTFGQVLKNGQGEESQGAVRGRFS